MFVGTEGVLLVSSCSMWVLCLCMSLIVMSGNMVDNV